MEGWLSKHRISCIMKFHCRSVLRSTVVKYDRSYSIRAEIDPAREKILSYMKSDDLGHASRKSAKSSADIRRWTTSTRLVVALGFSISTSVVLMM